MRHLHGTGTRQPLCGVVSDWIVTVHIKRARKTDCSRCREIHRLSEKDAKGKHITRQSEGS